MKHPHTRLVVAVVAITIGAGLYFWKVPWHQTLDQRLGTVEDPSTSPVAVAKPIYKPPKQGTPTYIASGGTRSVDTDRLLLSVLAPKHTGLTIHEQPTVYWYVSKPLTRPLVVRVIGGLSSPALLETSVSPPISAGIHALPLTRHGVRLMTGVSYHVVLDIAEDPAHHFPSVWAEGVIERVPRTAELTARLDRTAFSDLPAVYADEGLWFDALNLLSEMIRTMPDNSLLHEYRVSLLEQVGLDEVAKYQMQ